MEKRQQVLQYAMTNGAVLGIILIIFSLFLYIVNFMPDNMNRIIMIAIVNYGIVIVFVIYGIRSYRNKVLGGTISFGNAFLTGLLIVVFAAVLNNFYALIFNTIIDPGYVDRVYESMTNWAYDFYSDMGLPDNQIDIAMDRLEKQQENYSPLRTFFSGILGYAAFGAIVSLIAAAFLKKDPLPFGKGNQEE
ncbi:MAG: DUF4199 domain-containing protein [Bacteroidales bacterium]|nr:DUF4199 domain-containing protein [Bacteroidales bacterium]